MEPEVIEIPPPVPHSFNSKQKQVAIEVIDVDKDEDSTDIMVLDDIVHVRNKGKAGKSRSGVYPTVQSENFVAKSLGSINKVEPSKNFTQGSYNKFNFDRNLAYDNCYDLMDVDYAMLQAHFDSIDIPAGIEASVPWFADFLEKKKTSPGNISSTVDANDQSFSSCLSEHAHINEKAASVSNSSFQTPGDPLSHSPRGASLSSPLLFPQGLQSKKSATLQHLWKSQYLQFGNPLLSPQTGGLTNSSDVSHSDAMALHHTVAITPDDWSNFDSSVQEQVGASGLLLSDFDTPLDALIEESTLTEESMSWSSWSPVEPNYSFNKHNIYSSFPVPTDGPYITPQEVSDIRNQRNVNEEDILSKLQLFKQFDTVEDFSDHYYASSGSSTKQPPKNWAKKIQEEWKILERDLPDTIFVRVYESRMDLLRAVIIGAEGTPYHDGLFFFDVCFPAGYPKVPPQVHYHSGGLRLNPNLYNCGKVCLSLLNTWPGSKDENWIPSMSTMLQVLVSIQALILNQKPYFNEPGWASYSGTPEGESRSRRYNEDTFILSVKTMIYSIRRPPKHFEDFIVGHFYRRAHDILVGCKAYMDGAQVGCLVKGGIQDVDEGANSCSKKFKDSVAGCLNMLVKEFTVLGARDCEIFLPLPKGQNNQVDNMPKAAT